MFASVVSVAFRHRGKQDLGSLLRKVDPTITTQRAPWIPSGFLGWIPLIWLIVQDPGLLPWIMHHELQLQWGKWWMDMAGVPFIFKGFYFCESVGKNTGHSGGFRRHWSFFLRSLLYSKKSAMMEMMWWLSMSTLADLFLQSLSGETIQFLGFQKSPKPETNICQMSKSILNPDVHLEWRHGFPYYWCNNCIN